jgi:hypothetical protein
MSATNIVVIHSSIGCGKFATRYCCEFGNGAGDNLTITVNLAPHEVNSARTHADPELVAKAFALRHAYREVSDGFKHLAGGVVPVLEN